MTDHERLIPEVVLRHKDPEAREFIFEKYFQRYRKSKIIAFAWWAVACSLGAHRIYLGQYRAAAIVFSLFIFPLIILQNATSSGDYMIIFIFLMPIVFVVEGVWLYWNIRSANDKLNQRIDHDIETTPYIPRS